MRIAIYGNFSVPYCSEVHYANVLSKMGHEVIRLQENTVRTNAALRVGLQSNVFVWIHSHGFMNRGTLSMKQVIQSLKNANIPTVAYHLDLYMGLDRWKEYENSDYFKVEHFFTVDKLMADWFNENTQVKGHFLPAGVYDDEVIALEPQRVDYEVVFVGAKNYHNDWPYRPQLIAFLRDTYKDKFLLVGRDGIGTKRGLELNQIYSNAKIAIGDTLNIGFNYPYYSSDRLFESIGRGAFTIYPRIKGLEDYYEDGKEIVFYEHGNLEDLKYKIDYYLTHDDEREKIRKAGFERTKKEHLYSMRWEEILDKVC
jgi:hypothetical protein